MEERLHKIIARAGICARREAEQLILAGLVSVNGEMVTELGTKADLQVDHIKVRGKLIQNEEKLFYILLNKPKGVITTVNDPEGRPSVMDLVTTVRARIYPVGRLDFNTEGALLLTNDGDLANSMLSPKHKCPKTYLAKVTGIPDPKDIARLERGIMVDGTRFGACQIELLRVVRNTWAKVTLTEGKNHQVKKMFEAIGHPVSKLRRIAFGFLTTKGVSIGQFRHLTDTEVARLKRNDFKPLIPLPINAMLRELGVRVTVKDHERLAAYRAEKASDTSPTRRAGEKPNRDARGSKPGEGAGSSKWVAKATTTKTFERPKFASHGEDAPRPKLANRLRPKSDWDDDLVLTAPGMPMLKEQPKSRAKVRSEQEDDHSTARPERSDRTEEKSSRSRSDESPKRRTRPEEGRDERPSGSRFSKPRSDEGREERPSGSRFSKPRSDEDREERPSGSRFSKPRSDEGREERPSGSRFSKPRSDEGRGERPSGSRFSKPRSDEGRDERPSGSRFSKPRSDEGRSERPSGSRFSKPRSDEGRSERPSGSRFSKPRSDEGREERSGGSKFVRSRTDEGSKERSGGARFGRPRSDEGATGSRPSRPRSEEGTKERSTGSRFVRSRTDEGSKERPGGVRFGRPRSDEGSSERPSGSKFVRSRSDEGEKPRRPRHDEGAKTGDRDGRPGGSKFVRSRSEDSSKPRGPRSGDGPKRDDRPTSKFSRGSEDRPARPRQEGQEDRGERGKGPDKPSYRIRTTEEAPKPAQRFGTRPGSSGPSKFAGKGKPGAKPFAGRSQGHRTKKK